MYAVDVVSTAVDATIDSSQYLEQDPVDDVWAVCGEATADLTTITGCMGQTSRT